MLTLGGGVTVGQPSQLLMLFLSRFRKQHPPFSGRQRDQRSAEGEPGLERARGALRPRRGEDGRHEEQRPAVCRNCTQGGSRSAAEGSALGCRGALVPKTLFQYVSQVGGTKSSLFFSLAPVYSFLLLLSKYQSWEDFFLDLFLWLSRFCCLHPCL